VPRPPLVLVPGFWLGAWAWDEVADILRDRDFTVVALTLPGLESPDVDRRNITLNDHIDAIEQAIVALGTPVVLAVHSGAGAPGYAVTDRMPESVAAMVYVDSAPASAALNPSFEGDEWPLPSWEDLEDDGNSLTDLTAEQLATFRNRAVPEPAAAMRDGHEFTNDARRLIPSTVICSALTSEQIQAGIPEGWAWLGGLAELQRVTYLDLPTSHWPMWSKTDELCEILASVVDQVTQT
jgi:pimeloyl-ACP methyl ester carboxylesterase